MLGLALRAVILSSTWPFGTRRTCVPAPTLSTSVAPTDAATACLLSARVPGWKPTRTVLSTKGSVLSEWAVAGLAVGATNKVKHTIAPSQMLDRVRRD